MNFVLLAPVGLAALAALALPLLVHLARRTEVQPTDFAALRWLRANPRPRNRPRLDERLLMAVRLALLALLALWLAQPVLTHPIARTPWVAVTPGIDPARVAPGAHGIWLAPGFPALDAPAPSGAVPFASLVRELDATLPADVPLTVLVPPVIAAADAERPRVGRPVTWRVVPGRVTRAVPPQDTPSAVAIRTTSGAAGLRYLRAAVAALHPSGTIEVAPTSAPLPKSGVIIWWAAGNIPDTVTAWAARGGRLIVPEGATLPPGPVATVWRDTLGAPLAEVVTIGRGRIVRFTRPLAPAAMPILLDSGFPEAFDALITAPPASPTRIAAADYAPLQIAMTSDAVAAPRDLQPWFAVAIAAAFLLERWLATRRRRAPAP